MSTIKEARKAASKALDIRNLTDTELIHRLFQPWGSRIAGLLREEAKKRGLL